MSKVTRESILSAAMEAGCDEAERLGYGSTLGYVEAASIGERAAGVALDQLGGAASFTAEELHCLICAMAGNFPEQFAPIRMGLLRKLAKASRVAGGR